MIKLLTSIKWMLRRKHPFVNTASFWEYRYANGGNSGDGSYGRLAHFKADVINGFLKEEGVDEVREFGCGDGHQLGLIAYKNYTGLDISPSIIAACKEKYKNDATKSFYVSNEENIALLAGKGKADACFSLDVLYHLVEQQLFENYLNTLFEQANRFVAIYSTDVDKAEADHVVHRRFSDWVARRQPEWVLYKEVKNPFPGVGEQESLANFYFYKRK